MNDKIVTSQAELDAIPVDYNGRIIIKFGTPAERAVVSKKYLRSVEAHDNSSVWAKGNSSIYTYDNSSVCADGNSHRQKKWFSDGKIERRRRCFSCCF